MYVGAPQVCDLKGEWFTQPATSLHLPVFRSAPSSGAGASGSVYQMSCNHDNCIPDDAASHTWTSIGLI